jgi:glycerophosphoryl diester phosphodiesterase
MRTVALGFHYLEIDLRATADGRLVVWHGRGVERVRRSRRMDAARRLRRMSAHGAAMNGDLLLVDEVLRALPEDTRFFVELKDRHEGHLLTAVGKGAHDAAARICVGPSRVGVATRSGPRGGRLKWPHLACGDPRGRGELGP